MSGIRIDEEETEEPFRGGLPGQGDVTVTTTIPMLKRTKRQSRSSF